MKKAIVFFAIMLMFLTTTVYAQETPRITITLLNQDPDPAGPGSYVDVRFKINNDQVNSLAKDFQIQLDPQYPFSLDAGEETLVEIGDLPGMGGSNVIVVKYKVRIDEDVIEGPNPLKIKYKHGSTDWITREFDINVQTRDANLGIVSIETIPEKIKPGEETKVKIKVKNMADSVMKDVTLKMDLVFSNYLSTGTATETIAAFSALPFAPIGSATEQKIYSLKSGEEYEFEYDLLAYSDAESRIYKVPVIISYYDELGTLYTKNDIIGLVVGTKPDLSVIVDETDLYVGKPSGTVSIRFINKGFSDVKFLDVKLAETDEYELISSNEVYIGNVDSDDYETADFKIFLTNGATKQEKDIILPLKVEYRDANNNMYSEDYELELSVMSPAKLGLSSGPGATWIIVVIIIAAVAFFYFRRKKKKK